MAHLWIVAAPAAALTAVNSRLRRPRALEEANEGLRKGVEARVARPLELHGRCLLIEPMRSIVVVYFDGSLLF